MLSWLAMQRLMGLFGIWPKIRKICIDGCVGHPENLLTMTDLAYKVIHTSRSSVNNPITHNAKSVRVSRFSGCPWRQLTAEILVLQFSWKNVYRFFLDFPQTYRVLCHTVEVQENPTKSCSWITVWWSQAKAWQKCNLDLEELGPRVGLGIF